MNVINVDAHLKPQYANFTNELRQNAFSGDIATDYGTRLSLSTDNSIFQVIPQAVLFPRSLDDIVIIMGLAAEEKFRSVQFCPRGGGTSTNGQSLAAGIIIDCSRHMRAILELNEKEKWVRVQAGVILDELNNYLKEYGYCFAPEISTSNRATIGGMVNTDACGLGSVILGRTSDNVEALTCVLPSGTVIESSNAVYENVDLYEKIVGWLEPHSALIKERFTKAPRTLNGYNLQKIPQSLNYLFCGSEGTLAVIAECKLKIVPIPKFKKLLILKYHSFDDALRAVELTEQFKPLVVEAIDEKLLELARTDPIYFYIQSFIDSGTKSTRAINIIEFVSDNDFELTKLVDDFCKAIDQDKNSPGHAFGYYVAKDASEANLLWSLRKKSVGLISKETNGTRRPVPFIEDSAVPPENLADYIAEFRLILDRYNLVYGMYGHVDAGCVHVRPALDLRLEEDRHLVLNLTKEIVTLVEKYHGVLWGEHGQGHRCEYGKSFFGNELYYIIRQIKTLFDPYNQLNPGKIAIPLECNDKLVKINEPLRANLDTQISEKDQLVYSDVLVCNGNGACFNYATADVMCPSYKVTQDRIHSPKGRATLMREWLRQLSIRNIVLNPWGNASGFFKRKPKKPDFSQEVYLAMSGCLACKACTSQCPLNVDVPNFRAEFLAMYHQSCARPWRDYLIGNIERTLPWQAYWPRLTNRTLSSRIIKKCVERWFNLLDIPLVTQHSLKKSLKKRRAPKLNLKKLQALSQEEKQRSIVLLQDAFTTFYEPKIVLSMYDFLVKLGFTVYVDHYFPSGKSLHVKGFLQAFAKQAEKNYQWLENVARLEIPIIGIDPSITLLYRDEYRKAFPNKKPVKVMLIQEWLVQQVPTIPQKKPNSKTFYLLSHCTEKTMCVESEKNWYSIFNHFGVKLLPLPAGCCGMSGAYGHETEHFEYSKKLFDMEWSRYLEQYPDKILATGYSCRSQAARFRELRLQHPIEILEGFV